MLFWEGLTLGFLVAAPIGPIGLLCLSRTLAGGWSYGFLSGLGAATADAFYAGLAGAGVALLSRFLIGAVYFSLAGGLWLGWLGLSTLRTRPVLRAKATDPPGDPPPTRVPVNLAAAYSSTLALTMTNPLTILFFTAAYSGLAAVRGSQPLLLAAGAFAGSALWWLALTLAATALRTRLPVLALRRLNQASGLVILVFALVILFRAVG
ncbi:MAG: LysE family transporter [Peptococcaceae bacterium]|nr:LysE family transporter [Peptococcaceae bacterium]